MKKAVVRLTLIVLLFSMAVQPVTAAAGNSSWAVIDADTGRLLDGFNPHEQLPIASLTKMWTALTYLESGVTEEETVITPLAASAEGSSIYLEPGSKVKAEDLLYGLMLRSGNDAAVALAEHAGGSVEGFVRLMNEQAELYQLDNTHFTNPSGLHDETHLSSAYDTAMMLYYGMKNKEFRKIASAEQYTFRQGGSVVWQNKHRLVAAETDAVAGKTGFTKAAGRTLATYFEKNGKRVIVVTLNNGNDWNVHKTLADTAFRTHDVVRIAKKGSYAVLPGVTAELKQPIELLLTKEERKQTSSVMRLPTDTETGDTGQWIVMLDREPVVTAAVKLKRME
ncbi:D-alanyl-D-alanine carboxypeptidase [Sporosarcina sp. NCCP-2716]|uniref:D-alanyl-D-alanine carboxypeptidase family protein n=1 Tax=Sporosarcina sp. NCCP-2716 TaxID=2943679 RepID=UPI00203B59CB|nr:D-alanyl-D-alanine carboxypeptidase family protein [Sporosarcina sp. NCCP-2716]GKV67914.1 D-alanyl-D-alanine carboxypeptidase [Sporosarcina sp. NCCP-2716]